MPRRETRHDIEREMAKQRRNPLIARDEFERLQARMEQDLARARALLDPTALARVEQRFQQGLRKLKVEVRRRRRRPGDGSMPALVEPPRGPKPLAGGAAAPLEFD